MRVLLLNRYAADQADTLRRLAGPDVTVDCAAETEFPHTLARAFAHSDVLVSSRFHGSLPPAPQLRLIQAPTAGIDKIDFSLVPPGCAVCNVYEHEIGVAEYVMCAMLEWSIGLSRLDRSFRAGSWSGGVARPGGFHAEIYGRTLGIVGYGHIGRMVAERARSFGMTVRAVSRTAKPGDGVVDRISGHDQLDAVLPDCDFVLIACPLSPETRNLLDAARLAQLKRTAVLINVARAEVVEEAALFEALRDGRLGGAVLDVWYRYPVATDDAVRPSRLPFHELSNVIMTPHASAWTEDLIERRWRMIAENIGRLRRGEPLRNTVKPHA